MTSYSKTALITGANKGIGFQIAQELGRQGIKVFIGARNEANGFTAVDKLKSRALMLNF